MNFDEYRYFTDQTAIYPMHWDDIKDIDHDKLAEWIAMSYAIGKLNGEAGELAELHFKALRDEACILTDERKEKMSKELGDVLWYVARIAKHLGVSLDAIAEENTQKLLSRKARNVLTGSGSDR
jgi:NTP pyrophosphatase (non-canonical NTP hydrolase)